MVLQPAFGLLHLCYYLKHQSRSAVSYLHVWYGRALILAGIANGVVGLHLDGFPIPLFITYIVMAAVSGVTYFATMFIGWRRKRVVLQKKV